MPHQFDRMCEIYRQAAHIAKLAEFQPCENTAADTLVLIEELCAELARITGKVRQWDEFKKSLN